MKRSRAPAAVCTALRSLRRSAVVSSSSLSRRACASRPASISLGQHPLVLGGEQGHRADLVQVLANGIHDVSLQPAGDSRILVVVACCQSTQPGWGNRVCSASAGLGSPNIGATPRCDVSSCRGRARDCMFEPSTPCSIGSRDQPTRLSIACSATSGRDTTAATRRTWLCQPGAMPIPPSPVLASPVRSAVSA